MREASARLKHEAVVLYPVRASVPEHESVIHTDIAKRIAALMHVPFDGIYSAERHRGKRCYFVPTDTLISPALRDSLGIRGETDIFGGYADYSFMPTKAITHAAPGPAARRPSGWSDTFGFRVQTATLPGYTVFSIDDLHTAGARMLSAGGPVRLKPVKATGGRGQSVVSDSAGLNAAASDVDHETMQECGLVLEANLQGVATYSVGQVRLPGLTSSYIGTQRLTRDNHGQDVYGGSRLRFIRGGYAALHDLPLSEECHRAIELAESYDQAADECYPGFFASRRNYDVAAGTDAHGNRIMGVLEQSWRIGGASRAEVAALEVLMAEPGCEGLWAETLELFGDHEAAPQDAIQTYAGVDPDVGLIRKYIRVKVYGNKQ